MFGFLNINKPSGVSSHNVISKLRKITGIKQIGHAGTLDPLASGVLPVAIGKATKLIDYLHPNKSYQATMILGKISDTFDIEGNIVDFTNKKVSIKEIQKILNIFRGEIKQIPPAFSAVHYNGKRLYELAREGIIPDDIPSRKINIYKNDIISFDYENQILKLDISCSKGTYIRTIVNDIGSELKVGAVMSELKRTSSALMSIENSIELTDSLTKSDIEKNIIPPQNLLKIPFININDFYYKKVLNGNKFKNEYSLTGDVILCYSDKIIALAYADKNDIQPKKVLL